MHLKRAVRTASVAAIVAGVTGITGCAVYDSSLLVDGEGGNAAGGAGGNGGDVTAGSGAGGNGGTTDGAGAAPGTCDSLVYPTPPAIVNAGGDITFVAAIKSVNFGDEPVSDTGDAGGDAALDAAPAEAHPERVGFDLDKTCTADNKAGPFSCREPDWASGNHMDGPRGQDNAVGYLIAQLAKQFGISFGTSNYNAAALHGDLSIITQVSGYNGEADDDQVKADLFIAAPFSLGVQAARDAGSADAGAKPDGGVDASAPDAAGTDAGGPVPIWDGTDRWPIASDSVLDIAPDAGDQNPLHYPRYSDPKAFVTNHILVASLPTISIRLNVALAAGLNATIQMNLTGSGIVGEIYETTVNGEKRYALRNGTLAGRWAAHDLLGSVGQFEDPTRPAAHVPICTDNPALYCIFKGILCSFADISATGTSRTADCDALSIGVNFESVPATIGDVYIVKPYTARCPPQYDPANDICGNLDTPGALCGPLLEAGADASSDTTQDVSQDMSVEAPASDSSQDVSKPDSPADAPADTSVGDAAGSGG